MAAKNDRGREDAEDTDAEEAEASIVVTVPVPQEILERIDAHVSRLRGGPTRGDVLRRLVLQALDAEEKAAADERILN